MLGRFLAFLAITTLLPSTLAAVGYVEVPSGQTIVAVQPVSGLTTHNTTYHETTLVSIQASRLGPVGYVLRDEFGNESTHFVVLADPAVDLASLRTEVAALRTEIAATAADLAALVDQVTTESAETASRDTDLADKLDETTATITTFRGLLEQLPQAEALEAVRSSSEQTASQISQLASSVNAGRADAQAAVLASEKSATNTGQLVRHLYIVAGVLVLGIMGAAYLRTRKRNFLASFLRPAPSALIDRATASTHGLNPMSPRSAEPTPTVEKTKLSRRERRQQEAERERRREERADRRKKAEAIRIQRTMYKRVGMPRRRPPAPPVVSPQQGPSVPPVPAAPAPVPVVDEPGESL